MKPGKDGDLAEVLVRGTTKVTFAEDLTVGAGGYPLDNKIKTTGGGAGPCCCIVLSDAAADGDTGLVYFDFSGVVVA